MDSTELARDVTPTHPPSGQLEPPLDEQHANFSHLQRTFALPLIATEDLTLADELATRGMVLARKKAFSRMREDAFSDAKALPPSPERSALYAQIHKISAEEKWLEEQLKNDFVPQHGPSQFLAPRAFFQSALFRVCSRAVAQASNVQLVLSGTSAKPTIRYEGPELRQSDGRVFLALLHMLRDIRTGTTVRIEPNSVCHALYGRYDGNSRRQLRSHIQTLQRGMVTTPEHRVQLCKAFEHPSYGPWKVAMDPKIVELFRDSPAVWLSMPVRLSLSEGLTTWLYSYIACQTRLIPTPITKLQTECGSDAGVRSFTNALRNSLKELAERNIIDGGWSVRGGQLRWLKKNAPTVS